MRSCCKLGMGECNGRKGGEGVTHFHVRVCVCECWGMAVSMKAGCKYGNEVCVMDASIRLMEKWEENVICVFYSC